MDLTMMLDAHQKWLNGDGGTRANLQWADLQGANLQWADLRWADLRWAYLRWADLRWANLQGANLQGANLQGANLQGANLRWADPGSAIVDENTAGFWLCCPEEGAFVGWKKLAGGVIAKLLIPEDAKRSSATTRKCRADKAVVLWLSDGETSTPSKHDSTFMYTIGETVSVPDFCDDRWQECAAGIHFFITRAEAEAYNA